MVDITTITNMISPTKGKMELSSIADDIISYIADEPELPYEITVGTDSQNFNYTKIVEVVSVHRGTKGGIFFYAIQRHRKIGNIREKIVTETACSLELAERLFACLDDSAEQLDFSIDECDVSYQIHCDVGNNGRTSEIIPEIVGWVESCGYECRIKPESFAASSIADRFSK